MIGDSLDYRLFWNKAQFETILLAVLTFLLVFFLVVDNASFSVSNEDTISSAKTDSFVSTEFKESLRFKYYPVMTGSDYQPVLTAKAVKVVDYDSGFVFLSKNAYQKLPPASLVKLMTALISVMNCQLDKIVQIPKITVEGAKAGIVADDFMSIEELLYALLLSSGNDAAYVLSRYCANNEQFIYSMNRLANDLDMNSTHFTDPAGLDDENQYSTADDLVKLGKAVIENNTLAAIVSNKEIKFSNLLGTREYHFVNSNRLLSRVPGVLGIKTGTSQTAGENLISFVNRENRKLIIVVLGSSDRFNETERIINWVYSNFDWISLE